MDQTAAAAGAEIARAIREASEPGFLDYLSLLIGAFLPVITGFLGYWMATRNAVRDRRIAALQAINESAQRVLYIYRRRIKVTQTLKVTQEAYATASKAMDAQRAQGKPHPNEMDVIQMCLTEERRWQDAELDCIRQMEEACVRINIDRTTLATVFPGADSALLNINAFIRAADSIDNPPGVETAFAELLASLMPYWKSALRLKRT